MGRCAGWLGWWVVCAGVAVAGAWRLEFPALGDAAKAESVIGFGVGGGRVVSVVLPGHEAAGPRVNGGEQRLTLLAHDPVSRLAVMDGGGLAAGGGDLVLGSSVRIEAGAVVRVPGGGEGRVVGWVRRFAGRVLPVSLLRVNYSAEAPPAGSPLLGADGRVVAIGYQVDPQRTGTGFALPVEVCQRVLADLDQDGRVVRAWLGLTLKEGMAIPAVVRVDEESPAGRGGLQAGDVLLQVGAYPVNEYAEAVNAFYFLTGGRPVKVRILRGVEVLDLTLVPQALPAGAGRPEVRR